MPVIDLRKGADDSAKHIINAINAMADIKKNQIVVEQNMMLDKIKRERDLQTRRQEKEQDLEYKQKEQKSWIDMMNQGGQGQPTQSVSPEQSMRLSPTPNIPIGGQVPITTSPQGQPAQPQVAPVAKPTINGITLQPPQGRIYLTPQGPKARELNPIDQSYAGIYEKLSRGENISEGEQKLALEYNGYKPPSPTEKKAQMEIDEKAHFEEKQAKEEKIFAADMLKTIEEIEGGIKYFGAGGAVPTWVSPTDYKKQNWRANFDKLVSQRTIDTMTRMKQASKTGATGFGQLSNKELAVLENASTVLKRVMSEEDAKRYLEDMKIPLQKILGNDKSSGSQDQNEVEAAEYIKGILFQ